MIEEAKKYKSADEFVKTQNKGYVKVYHRTNASEEQLNQGFKSKEYTGDAFVSNKKSGQAEGYGENVIELYVPKSKLSLDDEFPSGEKHYSINEKHITEALTKKSQLTDIWNKAQGKGEVDPKKFKTAEEFVASKGKPLFHGTNEKFDAFDISKFETMNKGDWGKGIYLEPSVRGAKYYRDLAVGYKNKEADAIYKKLEAMPQSDPNWSSVRREWLDALEKARSDKDAGAIVEAYLSKDAKVLNHNSVDGMTDATLAEQARKDGYDVIHIDKGRYTEEVVVLNPDVIKTKSQLTDIWNKAHEKPATAEVAFPDRFAI